MKQEYYSETGQRSKSRGEQQIAALIETLRRNVKLLDDAIAAEEVRVAASVSAIVSRRDNIRATIVMLEQRLASMENLTPPKTQAAAIVPPRGVRGLNRGTA